VVILGIEKSKPNLGMLSLLHPLGIHLKLAKHDVSKGTVAVTKLPNYPLREFLGISTRRTASQGHQTTQPALFVTAKSI